MLRRSRDPGAWAAVAAAAVRLSYGEPDSYWRLRPASLQSDSDSEYRSWELVTNLAGRNHDLELHGLSFRAGESACHMSAEQTYATTPIKEIQFISVLDFLLHV